MFGFRKRSTAKGRRSAQPYQNFHVRRMWSNPQENNRAIVMTLQDDDGAEYSVIFDGDDVIATLRSAAINADCGHTDETHVMRSALET